MGLHYERREGETITTAQLVGELLESWSEGFLENTEEAHHPGEMAGIIDLCYEVQPYPGAWAAIGVPPNELLSYLELPMKHEDWGRAAMYGAMMQGGGKKAPPIILVGAEKEGVKGIALLDGRRRIHAAAIAGTAAVEAYLPEEHLEMMREAQHKAPSIESGGEIVGNEIAGAGVVAGPTR